MRSTWISARLSAQLSARARLLVLLLLTLTATPLVAAAVDIQEVTVRGTLDPVRQTLRTVARLRLGPVTDTGALSGDAGEVSFYLCPSRRVVRVLGPDGQEIPFRSHTVRRMLAAMVVRKVSLRLPPKPPHRPWIELTFFLDGGVADRGFFRVGNAFTPDRFTAMGNVLFPDLGVMTVGQDPFVWIDLELDAPPGWDLVTAGVPETTCVEQRIPASTGTDLTGPDIESFLGTASPVVRLRWPRIGSNMGLFYIYGGTGWTQQTRIVRGVPIRVHLQSPNRAMADTILADVEKILPMLEDSLGPFPFRDLTIAVPRAMHYGATSSGLDSWAMITLPPYALGAWSGYRSTLVHEMIHCYWDQSLRTPEDENLALCEPFASYLDDVYTARIVKGYSRGIDVRREALLNSWRAAAIYEELPLRGMTEASPFYFPGYYSKGALAVSMLHEYLGPAAFRLWQHEVFARGEGAPYTLDSLQAALDRHGPGTCPHLGRDLFRTTTRFDYAIEDLQVRPAGADSCDVAVTVVRKLEGAFPLDVRVSFADSARVDARIDPSAREQVLRFRGKAPFREAELDPEVRTLDCIRSNNVLPRRRILRFAWGRSAASLVPNPIPDWGWTGFSTTMYVLRPLAEYNDLEGFSWGCALESRRAYIERRYLWTAWNPQRDELHGGAGWCWAPRPLRRTRLNTSAQAGLLTREGIVTAFLPGWRDWLALSLGAGYEDHPVRIDRDANLGIRQGAASVRATLTSPFVNYGAETLLPTGDGRSYLLVLAVRKAIPARGTRFDALHVEGDTRLGMGRVRARMRWGLSAGADHPGEGFFLGGRWATADDQVRMVRGDRLRSARSFALLNTRYYLLYLPLPRFLGGVWTSAFADVGRCREVGASRGQSLLGYGLGLGYVPAGPRWMERPFVRVDLAAADRGWKRALVSAGLGSAF